MHQKNRSYQSGPFLPIIFLKKSSFFGWKRQSWQIGPSGSMAKGGYGMKGLLQSRKGLDKQRSSYYRALEEPERM